MLRGMSRAKEAMLSIVTGVSGNMVAGPLAATLAAAAAGTAAAPFDAMQCVAYGTLLLGSTFVQICQGKKAEAREAARIARVEKALRRVADNQDSARQELVDIALEQSWVREALEKPGDDGAAAFNTAWRSQVEAAMRSIGAGVADIQGTLAEMAKLEFDTNFRIREVAGGMARIESAVGGVADDVRAVLTEQQRIAEAIGTLAAELSESRRVEGMLRGENDTLKTELASVAKRYVATEEAKGRPWRDVIQELRHDPKKLGEFLDRETKEHDREGVEKHRERAAVWFLTGEIDKAIASLRVILALFPEDLDAMNRLGQVWFLRGNLAEATRLFTLMCELATDDSVRAISYGNLGLIERTRGRLDEAEVYHKKSLAIEEKLGRLEGIASECGNLGILEGTRGNLAQAEAYFKRSLAIEEKLERLAGMASDYGNLGLIEWTRMNLDLAESYLKKSLTAHEKLVMLEGMANGFSGLGLVEQARGNLVAAETYHIQSLDIEKKLGSPEGIAREYGNLGAIAQQRGNYAEAQRLWTLARDLFRKVGATPNERWVQERLDRLKE